MLYSFFGSDIEKVRTRSRALIEALRNKRADAGFFRIHAQNWSHDQFTELTKSIGLFSTKYIVVLDNILTGESVQRTRASKTESDREFAGANADTGARVNADEDSDSDTNETYSSTSRASQSPATVICEALPFLKSSEHIWIIVEDAQLGKSSGKDIGVKDTATLKEIVSLLKTHSDKIEEYEASTPSFLSSGPGGKKGVKSTGSTSNQEITSFVFTDAFFEKRIPDAVNALTLLDMQQVAPEEIHGALWWQLKVLFHILHKDTASLSPYAVQKSTRMLKLWNTSELEQISHQMIQIYHEAHAGKTPLSDALLRLTVGQR